MSDEKILKQLNNDANVIGYEPELEYKKERTATGQAISGQEEKYYDPEKDTTLYTKTLNGFAENMPSNVISDINYVLQNIDRLKQKLADRFNKEQALDNNPFYDVNIKSSVDNAVGGIPGNSVTRIRRGDIDPTGSDTGGVSGNFDPSISSLGKDDTEIILDNANTGQTYNPYNDINKLITAGNTGNVDFAKEFENMYNSLTGSVIPALINQLSGIESKLNNLNGCFKEVYYDNPRISLYEAQQIDNSYLYNMKAMERDGTNGKINYLTISYDATLNKLISFTVFQDNKSAIKVAKVIDSHEDTKATMNDMDILTDMFSEVENELDTRSRSYMKNNDLQLIQKSMYNYYEKRKNLNDVYNLYRNNPDSKFLGRKVTEYNKKLNNAVKNVSRVLMYNQNYLNQISDLEKQKYNLQRISRTSSSNN